MSLSVDCATANGDKWQASIDALGRALGKLAWQGADARVIVSNHFIRFALVPHAAKLRDDVERIAAARHQLRAVYGERAEGWRTVLGTNGGDGMALAAGIEPEVVEGITATLTAASVRPVGVEPFLATAFNMCRRSIRREPAWLAVAEPGRVCLAFFEAGTWRKVRSERVRAPLPVELPALLERSRLADGVEAGAGRVLFVSREPARIEFPQGSNWSLEPVGVDDFGAAAAVMS